MGGRSAAFRYGQGMVGGVSRNSGTGGSGQSIPGKNPKARKNPKAKLSYKKG